MELYTLDPLLRRTEVIDIFESLIWTERYNSFGDFQLDIQSTPATRRQLAIGTLLAMNRSNRVMTVESFEDSVGSDGKRMLEVKGRSLEAILYDRVAKESTSNLTTSPKWTITDAPAVVLRKIFHDICVTGVLDTEDIIPFINEGTFTGASNIPEPIDPITVDITPTTVYDAISQIAVVWNLGFRLQRQFDMSKLWFDIYTGNDRTTAQVLLPPVIFAPELDNLQNTKELTTTDKQKNVAYVFSPAGFQKVYSLGTETDVNGFDRHVLVVNASDITSDNPDVTAALIQRGNEQLANNRIYQGFDGEISQHSQYQYGRDYYLGDLVETRNSDGVTNDMRVTEQIFAQDAQGERSYPTLTLNVFITTGSWLSWLNNKVWEDITDTSQVWGNQP